VMDPTYNGKPSMISETTFTRPNRFRTEAPIFYAAYGALQGTDAIVHFAIDGADWSVKPNYWMQPWTLASPTMMGQFPAAALAYREGFLPFGYRVATVGLKLSDLFALKGTPLAQDASLDELRLKDVPTRRDVEQGKRFYIDPLVHFVGNTGVHFDDPFLQGEPIVRADQIDRNLQDVWSGNRELKLDYGKGVLLIDAEKIQGVVGDLTSRPNHATSLMEVSSSLVNACLVLVSLDGERMNLSKRMLLQVMSEEKPTDFRAEDLGEGRRRIANIGRDPWLVREIEGKVAFKMKDAANLKITKLDQNGVKVGDATRGPELTLDAKTIYYVVERK
jgi:hypothetical protein